MRLIVFLCVVTLASAAPAIRYVANDAQILRYDNNYGLGNFRWAFEQSDGTKHEQQGDLRNEGSDNEYIAMKGTFSWEHDGVKYTINYTADEDGYQPVIEQGPGGAVPAAVVASLLGAG